MIPRQPHYDPPSRLGCGPKHWIGMLTLGSLGALLVGGFLLWSCGRNAQGMCGLSVVVYCFAPALLSGIAGGIASLIYPTALPRWLRIISVSTGAILGLIVCVGILGR